MTNLHIVTPTTEPAPTADAYQAACEALERHRERADKAEAAIERDHELLLKSLAEDPAAIAYRYRLGGEG